MHFLSSESEKNYKNLILESDTTEQIINILDEIESSKDTIEYRNFYDSWDILIYYNNYSYKFNYNIDNNTVKKLIDLIIDISPIDVDMHGFA